MGDALAQVKKDLGRDAVILHTRSFKVGGLLGFGGRPVVEITASDSVNVVPRRGGLSGSSTPRAVAIVDNSVALAPESPVTASDAGRPVRTVSALRAYGVAPAPAVPTTPVDPSPSRAAESQRLSVEPSAPPVASGGSTLPAVPPHSVPRHAAVTLTPALDDELAAIRKMVGQVLQTTRQAALRGGAQASCTGAMSDPLVEQYLKLIEAEVAAEIADEVIAQVRDELTSAELSDASIVYQTVLRHLAALIPADGDTSRLGGLPAGRAPDGRPLTIALVGPTGVGKTTTVAKLAAAYKLRHGKRVGLVTSDTYRIAAVDQLRTYAEIIGLPLKVAMSPTDMTSVCESLRDCDVILIDTAGRSQRDGVRLEELRQFITAARPHQTHLVLSSTASESVLVEAAQRFGHVNPDRIIFTKVDEAVNFGVLVTVARKVALRLSYITTGQEVPDHIEVGRPERIARLLLDGREAK